ncbi:MAG: polysaccharide biosynthesis protein [Alphaproteobacteria bacterium]|nr:polysaccharide biosynthesis protein [Alphaproteobacteria bacterium]
MSESRDKGGWLAGHGRILLVALHDVAMAAAAFELAVWLRYQTYGLPQPFFFLWEATLLFAAVAAPVFWWVGMYRGIWHYASGRDLAAIAKGVTLALLVFLPLLFFLTRLELFPRTVLIILWPLLIVMLAGPRFFYRWLKDGNLAAVFERDPGESVPVLLAGAGDSADTFIREMARMRPAPYRVVGLLDHRDNRIGRDIRGIRVEGALADLAAVVERLKARGQAPQRVIVAADRIEGEAVRGLVEETDRLGLALSRLPRLTDFAGAGRLEVRPIEVEDLLGRPQKVLDRDAMARLIQGRRVLVTGAGGTIGGELARQIAGFGPAELTLLDHGEYALYAIDLDLAERHPALVRRAILADVADEKRIAAIFADLKPELVFHAAALKHVPLCEDNPAMALRTNVQGTRTVAAACRAAGTAAMVLISTDKAVAPRSVMGASKRLAELVCLAEARAPGAPRIAVVRFGNVLGSTGSVVPLFQRQLAAGGPLTVTDAETTRYFMTCREAVELVLQASALPAEAGRLFVLDMGAPVRIRDLARQMIRLSGRREVEIRYTGLRPGEKLHEVLVESGTALRPTAVEGVMAAEVQAMIDAAQLAARLAALPAENGAVRAALRALVPDYAPEEIAHAAQ